MATQRTSCVYIPGWPPAGADCAAPFLSKGTQEARRICSPKRNDIFPWVRHCFPIHTHGAPTTYHVSSPGGLRCLGGGHTCTHTVTHTPALREVGSQEPDAGGGEGCVCCCTVSRPGELCGSATHRPPLQAQRRKQTLTGSPLSWGSRLGVSPQGIGTAVPTAEPPAALPALLPTQGDVRG